MYLDSVDLGAARGRKTDWRKRASPQLPYDDSIASKIALAIPLYVRDARDLGMFATEEWRNRGT